MAYTPKEWKDLPDETTPIQASDLNHIEQGIGDLNTSVSNLNTSIGDLNTLNTTNKSSIVGAINDVYQNNVYSTDETVVGKWIDGKPIYRKVINSICGNLRTLLNELNIDFLIDIKGNAWSNYDHKMPINAPNPDPPNYVFGVYQTASNGNIEVFYNTNFFANQKKVICIVEYTKTTD